MYDTVSGTNKMATYWDWYRALDKKEFDIKG